MKWNLGLCTRPAPGLWPALQIADFGLCGLLEPGKRHVSSVKTGTPFYTAPEVVVSGTLTKAADVYSFGVLL